MFFGRFIYGAPGVCGSAARFGMSDPRGPNCLGRRWEIHSLAVLKDHRLAASDAPKITMGHVGSLAWIFANKKYMDYHGLRWYEGI